MATILSIVTALVFAAAGGSKLADASQSLEMRDQLGIEQGTWRMIGAVEVLGAIGVLIGLALTAIGVAALIGLLLTGLGAITAHVRNGDPIINLIPAIFVTVLAAVTLALTLG